MICYHSQTRLGLILTEIYVHILKNGEVVWRTHPCHVVYGFLAKDPDWEPIYFRVIYGKSNRQIMGFTIEHAEYIDDLFRQLPSIVYDIL